MREKVTKVDKEIETSASPNKSMLDIQTMYPSNSYYENLPEIHYKEVQSLESTESSKGSINKKEIEINDSGLQSCELCTKEPEGVCSACIEKKFCKGCFERFHISLPKFHSFIRNKAREERSGFYKKKSNCLKYLRTISREEKKFE